MACIDLLFTACMALYEDKLYWERGSEVVTLDILSSSLETAFSVAASKEAHRVSSYHSSVPSTRRRKNSPHCTCRTYI